MKIAPRAIFLSLFVICFTVMPAYAKPTVPDGNKFTVGVPKSGLDQTQKRIIDKAAWKKFVQTTQDAGVSISLGITSVYQLNLRKGVAADSAGNLGGVHRRKGRFTGTYDLELTLDLDKLVGIAGSEIRILAEGGFSDGLDASSVGSIMGINATAFGDTAIALTEFYYHQSLYAGRLKFRVGKLGLTGGYSCRHCSAAFDTNAYANDENANFMNGALVNNPTIPFPDKGLGASVFVMPTENWYIAAGIADGAAVATQTGFNTIFRKPSSTFIAVETGIAAAFKNGNQELTGAYRAGLWYDSSAKEDFKTGISKRDDVGFYLSFDQELYREKTRNSDDYQGLGAFFRFGLADPNRNDIQRFYSAGLQYTGLIPERDEDVLGVGYAYAKAGFNPDFKGKNEQVLEVYYNAKVTDWCNISPNFQYIKNVNMREIRDTSVVGIRIQLNF